MKKYNRFYFILAVMVIIFGQLPFSNSPNYNALLLVFGGLLCLCWSWHVIETATDKESRWLNNILLKFGLN